MKSAREIRQFDIEDIYVGERQRALKDEGVAVLVSSMKEIGLLTPIQIRVVDGPIMIDGEEVHSVPCLIAGAHRLEAAKRLGWEKIDCLMLTADDDDAQLWEIDENLARSELTTEQKREHLRHRKEIWERRQAERGTPRPTLQNAAPGQTGFAAETAAATGLSKRQINRLIAEPKVAETRRAPNVIKLPDDPLNEIEVTQQQVTALMSAWNKAGADAREQFLGLIDRPVFDRTRASA